MVPLLKFYFNEDVRASAAQVNPPCGFLLLLLHIAWV